MSTRGCEVGRGQITDYITMKRDLSLTNVIKDQIPQPQPA